MSGAWETIEREDVVTFPFKLGCACLKEGEGLNVWGGSPDDNSLYEF